MKNENLDCNNVRKHNSSVYTSSLYTFIKVIAKIYKHV